MKVKAVDNATPERLTVTVRQAACISGLSARSIWRLVAVGELASVKIGRLRLVNYRSLEALLLGDKVRVRRIHRQLDQSLPSRPA